MFVRFASTLSPFATTVRSFSTVLVHDCFVVIVARIVKMFYRTVNFLGARVLLTRGRLESLVTGGQQRLGLRVSFLRKQSLA